LKYLTKLLKPEPDSSPCPNPGRTPPHQQDVWCSPYSFAGLAEFERELIRERTGAGRIAAMKRGVRFGRPAKLDKEKAALATRLIAEGRSVKEVAKTFGVHKATLYRAAASQDTSIKA
jgi:hypothetical protein